MDKHGLELTRIWFDDIVREALDRARQRHHVFWLSETLTIPPIALSSAFAAAKDFGWLFWRPDGMVQLGLGVSREWQWHHPTHLADMEHQAARLRNEGLPPDTWVVGGQAFHADSPWDGWPTVYLAIPLIQIVQDAEKAIVRLALPVHPDQALEAYQRLLEPWWDVLFASTLPHQRISHPQAVASSPGRAEWLRLVADTVQRLRRGPLDKVVLARSLKLSFTNALPVPLILDNLRSQNPDATVFAVQRHGSIFLGASPELLIRVRQNQAETMSLAGSAARGITPEDDSRLARAMIDDPKTQREHRVVKEHVTQALSRLTHDMMVASAPTLKKLPSVQHLWTPITAQLNHDADIWKIVAKLHPTPAVAGYPVPEAIRYLIAVEPFTRGWYAGSLGWTSLAGDGEWIVALRSGRLDPHQALLYAGCGIMADSDPETELAESDWKFSTMLSALEVDGEKP